MALSFAFDAARGETPETVAARRKTADALAARIFGRTPQNFGEGLSAIGSALIASKMMGDADEALKAGTASGNDAYSRIFSGMTGQPSSMSGYPTVGAAPVAPTASAASTINQGGQNVPVVENGDVPSPLDPVSGKDRDLVIRTVYGEDPGASAAGVAHVIRNRTLNGGYGGNTPSGVVLAKSQFEPWSREDAKARMLALDPNSAEYQRLGKIVDDAWAGGEDPTGGATHFFSPTAQAALGRAVPKWGAGPGLDIGTHRFFGGRTPAPGGAPTAPAPAAPNTMLASATPATATDALAPGEDANIPTTAQPAQGALPSARAVRGGPSLQQLMQAASNPWLNEGQRAVVNQMLKQRLDQDAKDSDPLHQLQIKKMEADIAYGKNPESVREYEYAQSGGFKGTFQDWIASKRSGAGEYGLNGIWGTGPDNKPAIIQLGKNGKPILTPMPEGFQPNKDAQKVDLGTHWGILDPTTRQLVTTLPKDLRGAEREKGVGEAQGKALAAAPADIQAGQNALDYLKKIREHSAIDRSTGAMSIFNKVWGTGGYDFQNLVEQAKSGAFLQAIQQMRGLGSLSNAEGGTATAAVNRMNTATSKKEFLDALNDYETVVKQGMDRAQARLADPAAINPQAPSKVDDLLKKYGGPK